MFLLTGPNTGLIGTFLTKQSKQAKKQQNNVDK